MPDEYKYRLKFDLNTQYTNSNDTVFEFKPYILDILVKQAMAQRSLRSLCIPSLPYNMFLYDLKCYNIWLNKLHKVLYHAFTNTAY